jgi:hypothetical protein
VAVPLGALDSPAWRTLRRNEIVVFLALARFADADWVARPGMKRLASITGLGLRTVERAIHGIEHAGLIKVTRSTGGRGSTNIYNLNLITPNPGAQTGVYGEKNPVKMNPETPSKRRRKPRSGCAHNQIDKKTYNRGAADAAGGRVGDDQECAEREADVERIEAVMAVLVEAGVWESEAATLARRCDLTPARARRAVEHAKANAKTNPPAYLIQFIRRGSHVPKPKTAREAFEAIREGLIESVNGTPVAGSEVTHNSAGLLIDGRLVVAAGDVAGGVYA